MGLGSGMQTNDCLEALLADPNLLGLLSPGEEKRHEEIRHTCGA
jgi:hypothetical protein